jgi:hypothetical protein
MQRKRDERDAKLREYEQNKKSNKMNKIRNGGGGAGSADVDVDHIPEINSRAMDQGQYLTYALARKMKNDLVIDNGGTTFAGGSNGNRARGVGSSRVGVAPHGGDGTSTEVSLNVSFLVLFCFVLVLVLLKLRAEGGGHTIVYVCSNVDVHHSA